MKDTSDIPSTERLHQALHRKMLVSLAASFIGVGALYAGMGLKAMSRPELTLVPLLISVLSSCWLVIGLSTKRFQWALSWLCVCLFVTFTAMAWSPEFAYARPQWWLQVPVIVTLIGGVFSLTLGLAAAFVLQAGGAFLLTPELLVSRELLNSAPTKGAVLVSTYLAPAFVVGFVALSVHWSRLLQKEVERARQIADEALRAKSLFLAKVSHEIRTPLNGMLGATELMRSETTPEPQRKQLLTVQEHSAQMLLSLVNDILDFSKLEAGKLTTDLRPICLSDLIFNVTELFSVQAFDKGLDLTCSHNGSQLHTVIGDDHRLRQILTNLVSNAIKFTEHGGIHIHLQHDEAISTGGRRTYRIEVTDTGRGIPADRMPSLFSPYAQADKSVARIYGGTGLGLNISQELAKLMGGNIECTSTVGKGTVFTVIVPLLAAESDSDSVPPIPTVDRAMVAAANPGIRRHMKTLLDEIGVANTSVERLPEISTMAQKRATVLFVDANLLATTINAKARLDALVEEGIKVALLAPLGSDVMVGAATGTTMIYKPVRRNSVTDFLMGAPPEVFVTSTAMTEDLDGPDPLEPRWLRVLVADDNPVNQMVTQAMLSNLNCDCVLVHNGLEALDKAMAEPFDAVLMDVEMPEMDGVTASREIRILERTTSKDRLPIIAMTGLNEASDVATCLAAGMDRHLSKPFGITQLRRTLEAVTPARARVPG